MMLGTQGGPIPGARAATATALVVDGAIYLVDAGAGLPIRFSEARLDFAAVRALFVTHLHSDHYADAFTFLTVNWTNWDFGRQLIQVHGPGRAAESGPTGSTAPGLPERPTAPLVAPELSTPGSPTSSSTRSQPTPTTSICDSAARAGRTGGRWTSPAWAASR